MNSAQVEVFGGVVEQLDNIGYKNLRTEHENGVVRFYGCHRGSVVEDFIATIDSKGDTVFELGSSILTGIYLPVNLKHLREVIIMQTKTLKLRYFDQTVQINLEPDLKWRDKWRYEFTKDENDIWHSLGDTYIEVFDQATDKIH